MIWLRKQIWLFKPDRQEPCTRRENILIYGVEEDKEDNDDGE